MKRIFYAIILFATVLVACCNLPVKEDANSINSDTTLVDSTNVDSVSVDTLY